MGGALSRASPLVDAPDVDAAVLHRFDAGDLDQLARGGIRVGERPGFDNFHAPSRSTICVM